MISGLDFERYNKGELWMSKDELNKVELRGGFSDRMRIKPINTEIQTDSLDDRTRVSIINCLNAVYKYVYEHDYDL